MFEGGGAMLGGLSSSVIEKYYSPYYAFGMVFLTLVPITIVNMFMPSEVETNQYATLYLRKEQSLKSEQQNSVLKNDQE